MHRFACGLAVAFLASGALAAQAHAAPFKTLYEALAEKGEYDPKADKFKPALNAKVELERFRWLEGKWRQKASLYAIGAIPAVTSDAGLWTFSLDQDANAIRYAPEGAEAKDHQLLFMAYDPYSRVWYGVEDNFDAWGTLRSASDWTADKVVMTGTVVVRGVETTLRQTFIRVAAGECAVVNEQKRPDRTWVKIDEHRFFRAPAK
jgi:hypothetical protein